METEETKLKGIEIGLVLEVEKFKILELKTLLLYAVLCAWCHCQDLPVVYLANTGCLYLWLPVTCCTC